MKFTAKRLNIGTLTVALMLSFGLVGGSAQAEGEGAKDDRKLIVLKPEWKNQMKYEMRNGLLPTIQAIVNAVAEGDMKAVSAAARPRGKAHKAKMNMKMMSKIPKGMKMIGRPMRMAFDDLAQAAESGADAKVVLGKLGDVMTFCTSCHNAYRLD